MSTTTTRLGLTKPLTSENYDVTIVNANADKIDTDTGFLACTSSTRPSVPYNGQAIRETDTNRAYVWDGAGWRQVPIANPSGVVSTVSDLAVTGNVTAANLNGPMFSAVQTVAQSLANNTFASITFTTEVFDTHNGHSTVTNTSRFTVPTGWDGYYQIGGLVYFASGTAGVRVAQLTKNGVAIPGSLTRDQPTADNGGNGVPSPSVVALLAAGDFIEVQGLQNSGAAVNTFATPPATSSLSVAFLRK